MNAIWEKIVNVLNDQQIKDFFSGKTSPVIKTENVVKVDTATITLAGKWIVGGLLASALLTSLIIGLFIKWALKPVSRT